MNYSFLIEQVENFVKSIEVSRQSAELPYHNIRHTEHIVRHGNQIARHYNLGDNDYFIVTVAAWLVDYDFYLGVESRYEEKSTEKSTAFLRELKIDSEIIIAIENCILSTRLPQSPKNLVQQIVCDAALYDLGTNKFSDVNKSLRKEEEMITGTEIDKTEWRTKMITFLESHHYHTDFCRDLLEDGKKENLKKLKKKVEKGEKDLPDYPMQIHSVQTQPQIDKEEKEEPKSDKKQKSDRPDKGIETMFRISSGNHQRLSDMADNKANIMITTNSIIISVLLSILLRKLEDNSYLIVPTLMLLTVCVTTMVFSILATRPSVPHGTFSKEDIDSKRVNLLFFGNFYRMSYKDYAGGIQEMMNDRDFLYGSLTKDVYAQGVVLGKKYKLLRTGYNIFMFGIVISVVAFVVSSMFFGS